MSKNYITISGAIFGFVSVAHVVRALTNTPIQLGTSDIPVWMSWVGALISGALCVWAFRAR
jgi:hypothetical protein